MSGYSPILELGDGPLAPREKVARIVAHHPDIFSDDPIARHRAASPFTVEVQQQKALNKADAILTALASGSGDHAELARMAEAATPGPWSYRDMTPNTYGPAFVDSAEVQSLAICGEAVGLSETHGFCLQVDSEVRMANAAFIVAANPATVLALLAEIAALRAERIAKDLEIGRVIFRATEAERKLAEADQVIHEISETAQITRVHHLARTFLSKEAERG